MRRFRWILVVSLFLAGTLSKAQTPYFQQYFPLKKNQPVQINSTIQDHKGFIWLGTDKGLFRFDGQGFRKLASSDSLPADQITALAEDTLGRIWIGHQSGAISYLEGGVVHAFETREGSAVAAISDILFDRNGTMWFATKDDGLYYFVNNRLYRVDEEEGLPDRFVYDLFEDPEGYIWAGTDGGIAVCQLTEAKVSIRVIDNSSGLPDIIIRKIKKLDDDLIAVATEDAGILSINRKTNEIRAVVPAPWKYGTISDFVVKEKQVWVATPRNGLVVYDGGTAQEKTYREFQGISLHAINTLLLDHEGNIWTGSKSGMLRTMGDAVEHLEILQAGSDNNVLALTIDQRDRIWFSTNEGLFVRSEDARGNVVVTKKLQNTTFRNSPVISLYIDPMGYVWAGLYGDGLLRINPDGTEVKHFGKELRNGNILSITGSGNQVWLATLGGSTSIRFDGGNYEIRNFGSSDGLSSDFIYQVFMDTRGRTWFATDGKGVSMLDANGFHHYQEGLSSAVVYSIAEDINRNIWVSVQDNGVFLFRDGKFVAVPEMRLRDNSIYSLVADRQGNLIAFHNFGVDVFDVNQKRMRYWGEESGIRDKKPNLNAVAADRFGRLYFGMTRGIVKFSLSNDHTISVPEPVIDDVRIFGQSVDFSRSPKLKYNENNVTLHYLGFWYQNATNLNYLYKLENYDVDWIATKDADVTYSRLPAGDYTFKLKVSDSEDFTHAKEASVSFSIHPPFWRTGAFYVFVIGLFFICAYGVIRYRERKLLEDKLILEAKVEERTREIQQKTEEIQAQNEEIMAQAEEIQGINENLEMLVKQRTLELEKKNKALEEYAFINAHKLRSPVASILGLVNLLAKAGQTDDTKAIREHLQQSADKLDAVVRSITEAIEKADNKYL